MRVTYLNPYLARYLFISATQNDEHLLHLFLKQAAKLYPPLSDRQRPVVVEEDSESEEELDL